MSWDVVYSSRHAKAGVIIIIHGYQSERYVTVSWNIQNSG